MPKILYHYCSAQTGFAILQSRSFRLSPLSSANDSLEGRVLGRVFSSLLKQTNLSRGVIDVASIIAEGYADATEGFAFCLSEQGDLLSQWRAYSQNGTGLSIGFDSGTLTKDFGTVNFGARFYEAIKVRYGEDELHTMLLPIAEQLATEMVEHGEFVRLREGITRQEALQLLADRQSNNAGLFQGMNDNADELLSKLLKFLAPLHFQIYGTKPQPFHEEREWRLLRYRHRVAQTEIEYVASESSIRPYINCLIADPAKEAIRQIVLGPKHTSNIDWIRAFLTSVGLDHVEVIRSCAESYR